MNATTRSDSYSLRLARATLRSAGGITTLAATSIISLAVGMVITSSAHDSGADVVIGIPGNNAGNPNAFTPIDGMLARDADNGASTVRIREACASVWPVGPCTHDESVAALTADTSAEIDRARVEHPGEQVILRAHSLGGPAAFANAGKADKVIIYGGPNGPHGIYSWLPGIYLGTSSPGAQELPGNVVNYCHYDDLFCNGVAPWSDPARFIQSVWGTVNPLNLAPFPHYYAPGEGDDLPPGDYVVPSEQPIKELPGSTPTGIPAVIFPAAPLPAWEPGPLPNISTGLPPYEARPLRSFLPAEANAVLPPEVLNVVPGPMPVLPPVPEIHIPGLF